MTTPTTQILTRDEVARITHAIPPRYRTMVLLAAEAGLRWSELMALRASDFYPAASTIVVSRVMYEGHETHAGVDRRDLIGPPKSGEFRAVPINEATCATLTEHIRAYPTGPDDLLFTTVAGQSIRRQCFNNSIWLPALHHAGIERRTPFYALRRTCASWWSAQGVATELIAEWLGFPLWGIE